MAICQTELITGQNKCEGLYDKATTRRLELPRHQPLNGKFVCPLAEACPPIDSPTRVNLGGDIQICEGEFRQIQCKPNTWQVFKYFSLCGDVHAADNSDIRDDSS